MPSITGATAAYQISVPGVFSAPIQLQGFAVDDVFDTDDIESAETLMGVDGKMSTGFVFVPVDQKISLQADSSTMFVFDQWWAANQAAEDNFSASGIVWLKALGQKWVLTKGSLVRFKPMPPVKKLIQPRSFTVRWESISAAPT